MESLPRVVIGFLGTVLDAGFQEKRWRRWRPTVSLGQQAGFPLQRIELLLDPKSRPLAEQLVADLGTVSPATEVRLHEVSLADPWDFAEVYGALFAFVKAYPFRVDDEEYLVHITTGTHVVQICWFLLTETRFFPGKLIQTAPARGGGPGTPQGHIEVIDLDLSKYDKLAARFAQERLDSVSVLKSGIETRNERFNRMIDQIERVAAQSKSPILLTGPTGAGKSRLARQVYELKRERRQIQGPFVEVNCATLRGDNAMSTLFGHVKGAFTGATGDRPGLLRSAHGGLLFLDEVGELGIDEQAMLLRAIEEKRFHPVGSDKEVSSDFQLIAGTNRDLSQAVHDGHFRDDLLARINLWTYQLPALRERREDLEPNLNFELEQFARHHGQRVTFNREAWRAFLEFARSSDASWNGNFRDLNAAVTRMATLAVGGRINVDVVQEEIDRLRRWWRQPVDSQSSPVDMASYFSQSDLDELDLFDVVQLREVIQVCRASRTLSDAGRTLFAASRRKRAMTNDADRLRKYLARFGLTWERVASST